MDLSMSVSSMSGTFGGLNSPRGLPIIPSTAEAVQVAVRVRPFNGREMQSALVPVVTMDHSERLVTLLKSQTQHGTVSGPKSFRFDHVFWSMDCADARGNPPATQADVFEAIGEPVVDHAFNGFNACILAYGQTGSGKTHTMMGELKKGREEYGLIPRLCHRMFEQRTAIEQSLPDSKWTIQVGFLEVYNEQVIDLLQKKRGPRETVEIRDGGKQGVLIKQALKTVNTFDEIARILDEGNDARRVAATNMNQRSSRSHAIFQLVLTEQCTAENGARYQGKSSRINLVDLAGSERVSQSKVEGAQFDEAKFINLSLSMLGNVIDALADAANKEKKRGEHSPNASFSSTPRESSPTAAPHIPYRNSKLTFILKDSIGGNSKTFMIATISPSELNVDETSGTLRYASRAREVVNTVTLNEDQHAHQIRKLKEEVERLRLQQEQQERLDPELIRQLKEKQALRESQYELLQSKLHSLELENEKAAVNEQLLHATEEEKAQLLQDRAQLEAQLKDARVVERTFTDQIASLRIEQRRREEQHRAELEKREQEVSKIQQELKKGQVELEATIGELTQEKATKHELAMDLEAKKEELSALVERSSTDQAKQKELHSQLGELQERLARLQREEAMAKKWEKELMLARRNQRLEAVIAEERRSRSEIVGELYADAWLYIAPRMMRSAVAAQRATQDAEYRSLIEDKENFTQQLQREQSSMRHQLTSCKHRAEDAEVSAKQLQLSLDSLRAESDRSRKTATESSDIVSTLRSEIAELKAANENLRSESQTATVALKSLNIAKSSVDREVATRTEEASIQVSRLEAEVASLRKEMQALQESKAAAMAIAEEAVRQSEKAYAYASQDSRSLMSRLEEVSRESEVLRTETVDLRAQLRTAVETNSVLEMEFKVREEARASSERRLNAVVEQLRRELDETSEAKLAADLELAKRQELLDWFLDPDRDDANGGNGAAQRTPEPSRQSAANEAVGGDGEGQVSLSLEPPAGFLHLPGSSYVTYQREDVTATSVLSPHGIVEAVLVAQRAAAYVLQSPLEYAARDLSPPADRNHSTSHHEDHHDDFLSRSPSINGQPSPQNLSRQHHPLAAIFEPADRYSYVVDTDPTKPRPHYASPQSFIFRSPSRGGAESRSPSASAVPRASTPRSASNTFTR